MSTKYKNLLKAIFEFCLIAIVLIALSRVMMLKSEDGYTQMQSFYKQKNNTIDALFLGSSRVYCQIDTGILWDEQGISGYDLGGAEATTWNSYYYFKEALRTQRPKVVLYDVGILAYKPEVEVQESKWVMTNNYGMKWGLNRINQLRANTLDYSSFRKLFFPLDTMHSRYLDITENDFNDINNDVSYKGFDYRDAVTPLERPDVSYVTDRTQLSDKQEEYLLKMFELSKAENIPFVVVVAPYQETEDDQKIYNYISDLCNENEIQFINFNRMYDELDIDFSSDYAENLHMNFSGTKKYSSYLGQYIVNNYDITDHRGDIRYASWERDALICRHNRSAYFLKNGSDFNEKSAIVYNKDYIVFEVDNMANLSVYDDGEEIIHHEGSGEYRSNVVDGDLRLIVSRSEDITTININREEIVIGFPWRRIVAYDKVLNRVVYDFCYYEE